MSTPTPSYYPQGWDRERLLNASDEESATLTQAERDTFREGLLADLGEKGAEAFNVEKSRRWHQRHDAEKAAAGVPPNPPLFLETMARWTQMTNHEWQQWGFVVFRTAGYGEEADARWREMRQRWDQVVDAQIDEHLANIPGVREAKERLQFRWVEDPDLEGADPATIST